MVCLQKMRGEMISLELVVNLINSDQILCLKVTFNNYCVSM